MNNIFTVILSVLIGVLAGVSLLVGINNTMINANLPIFSQLKELTKSEGELQKKVLELSTKIEKYDSSLQLLLVKADRLSESVQAGARPNNNQQAQQQQPPSEDFNKVYDIPVGNSFIIGKKDAPVTIVKFSDLQCPFCQRFYPAIKETLKNYPNKVRLIIKHFPLPFHPNARPAAKLAMAAGEQGKYSEMIELLLENGADVSEAKVKEYAKKAGLNYNRLMDDVKKNDAKYEGYLAEDAKLVQSSDVRGTPTFFVNGKKVQARDAQGFKQIIDAL